MKQKMRIKLFVNKEKYRQRATQIAIVAKGVTSVTIEGISKNELVVVGDDIDGASLVLALRKRACYATLQTLEEVKPPEKPKVDAKPVAPQCCIPANQYPLVSYQQPQPDRYVLVHDSYGPTPGCTIM